MFAQTPLPLGRALMFVTGDESGPGHGPVETRLHTIALSKKSILARY